MARQTQARFVISTEDRSTRTVRRIKEEFRGLERDTKRAFGGITSGAGVARKALGGLAGLTAIESVRRGLTASVREFSAYERSLVSVVKTSNLAGAELEAFEKKIASLERTIPVSAQELNKFAATAAQLGVRGVSNLSKFADTFARLERSSDIVGEAGAQDAARLFNITGTDLDQIDRFGASIVGLGNDAAATEAQILHMATFVGQSIARFDVGITDVLGLSTAMKELGLRAELSGGAIGRAFSAIQNLPQLGGDKATELARLMGAPLEEISQAFQDDAIETFVSFLEKLNQEGEAAGLTLERLGLGGTENARVFPVLAENVDLLTKRLEQASEGYRENTALIEESNRAFDTHEGRVQQAANAWSQLSREIGESVTEFLKVPLQQFADGVDGLKRAREAARNPLANLSTAEAESELARLIAQFENLDKVIAGVEPLPGGVTDPFEAQDRLTPQIAALKDRLGVVNEEQEKLAVANGKLHDLFEERKKIFRRIDAEGGGFTADFEGASRAIEAIDKRIVAQEKTIRGLKGITEAEHQAEQAAKALAKQREEAAKDAEAQAEAEKQLVALKEEFVTASRSKADIAREEITAIEAKFAPLVEEGRITQDQLDAFVRSQSVKLGLLKEEITTREGVIRQIQSQTAAEARQAESFVSGLLTQEERLIQKVEELRRLPEASFEGLGLDKSDAIQRALEDLADLNTKAAEEAVATQTQVFDSLRARAESLRLEFETPFEELTRRIREIQELTAQGFLSVEESERFVAQLNEDFQQIENRWEGLTQTMRGAFRGLLRDSNLDFKEFALNLIADAAAAEFDRAVFGENGILASLRGGREEQQPVVAPLPENEVPFTVKPIVEPFALPDPEALRVPTAYEPLPEYQAPPVDPVAVDVRYADPGFLPATPAPIEIDANGDAANAVLDEFLFRTAQAVEMGVEPPSDEEVQRALDAVVRGIPDEVPVPVAPFPVIDRNPTAEMFGLQDGVEVPINPGPIDPSLFPTVEVPVTYTETGFTPPDPGEVEVPVRFEGAFTPPDLGEVEVPVTYTENGFTPPDPGQVEVPVDYADQGYEVPNLGEVEVPVNYEGEFKPKDPGSVEVPVTYTETGFTPPDPGEVEVPVRFEGAFTPPDLGSVEVPVTYTENGFTPPDPGEVEVAVNYADQGYRVPDLGEVEVPVNYTETGFTPPDPGEVEVAVNYADQGFRVPDLGEVEVPVNYEGEFKPKHPGSVEVPVTYTETSFTPPDLGEVEVPVNYEGEFTPMDPGSVEVRVAYQDDGFMHPDVGDVAVHVPVTYTDEGYTPPDPGGVSVQVAYQDDGYTPPEVGGVDVPVTYTDEGFTPPDPGGVSVQVAYQDDGFTPPDPGGVSVQVAYQDDGYTPPEVGGVDVPVTYTDEGFTPPDPGGVSVQVAYQDDGYTPPDVGGVDVPVTYTDDGFTPPDPGGVSVQVAYQDDGYTPPDVGGVDVPVTYSDDGYAPPEVGSLSVLVAYEDTGFTPPDFDPIAVRADSDPANRTLDALFSRGAQGIDVPVRPMDAGADLAATNTFALIRDEAAAAADDVQAAWNKSNDNALGGFRLFGDETIKLLGDVAGQAGNILGSIFRAETGGVNLGGVFGTLLSGLFGGAKSFDGGGFTGFGSRSGGIDGQGGFPAILHPNEQVIDLTRSIAEGSGTSGGFTQVLHIQPGVSQDMIPQIMEAAKQGALEGMRDIKRRGGRRARLHGVS